MVKGRIDHSAHPASPTLLSQWIGYHPLSMYQQMESDCTTRVKRGSILDDETDNAIKLTNALLHT